MKKQIISVFISLAVLNGTCYADLGISQKSSSGECEISGQLSKPDMSVAFEILQQGMTEDALKDIDYTDAEDTDRGLAAAFTLKTDENGRVSRKFIMPETSGDYTFRWRASDGTSGSGSFRYTDAADTADFVSKVNSANSAVELYALLESEALLAILDTEYYQLLPENGQTYALSYLVDKKFEDFEQLSEAFLSGVLEAVLKYKPSGEIVVSALEAYENLTSAAQAECYEKYRAMDESKKAAFGDIIVKNKDIDSIDTYNSHFDEMVIIAYVSDSEWTELEEPITQYSSILGISLQKYNELRNKSSVLKSLSGKKYYSAQEFAEAFDKAVEAAGNTGNTGGGQGGSGSGGTSGGGGVIIANEEKPVSTVPPVSVDQTDEPFDDIGGVPWAKEAIEGLQKAGIVNGKTERGFFPNDPITREEFLKLIVEGLGLTDDSAQCGFDDVPQDSWYYKYVAAGVEKGIVNGISEKSFGAGSNISRQDMAVMTVRALDYLKIELKPESEPVEFDDGISEYAVQAVRTLQTAGIINGVGGTSFAPYNSATRAEAAKVVYGVLKSTGRL